jgi:hypothetical protein
MYRDSAIDGAVGTAGITMPFWLEFLNTSLQEVLLVGGAILIVLRCLLAVREWHDRSHK